jgi:multiple sugar transport system ATP-binding protein
VARVDFEGVTKDFEGGVRAVDQLSMSVADGEFMVLVGPSGCGKTTALRMTAGLEAVSEGTISIGGRKVNDLPSAKRDIAMVFQNYALYPHMSVFENMAFGLQQHRMPKREIAERVHEVARLLELEAYLSRKPKALSGGQRQRVAMGRAIVRRPAVFLMDEPLSNLDAKLRVQMRAEIRALQRKLGVTTLYVTHDQTEAMTMGDRVAVMRKGVLQQVASPHEVFRSPVNLFVAGFIGSPAMNLLDARVSDGGVLVGAYRLPVLAAGALAQDDGRPLALGVRPEDVRFGVDDGLAAHVVHVEDLGAEVIVHLEAEAAPVVTDDIREIVADTDDVSLQVLASDAQAQHARIVARLDADADARVGDRVALHFDVRKLHLFDPETGLALQWRDDAQASGSAPTTTGVTGGEHRAPVH